MKKEQKLIRGNAFVTTRRVNLPLTIFDQQEGKLVTGIIVETTATWFALQCTDGQVRKFAISLLPLDKPGNFYCHQLKQNTKAYQTGALRAQYGIATLLKRVMLSNSSS